MENQTNGTSWSPKRILSGWQILLCFLIPAAGLAAGPFFDLQIDTVLFNPSALWARILAAYGALPIFWILNASGCILIHLHGLNEQQVLWKRFQGWGMAVIFIAAGIVYITKESLEVFGGNPVLLAAAAALLTILPGYGYYRLIRKCPVPVLKRVLCILLITALGSFITVQVVKRLWMRPRFIAMLLNPQIPFYQWFQPAFGIQNAFPALFAADKDLFRSFPSGHTQSAACLIAWVLIPWARSFLKNGIQSEKHLHLDQNLIFAASLILTAIVAVSRLVMGKHFLSDVSMGFLITWLYFFTAVYFTASISAPARILDKPDNI